MRAAIASARNKGQQGQAMRQAQPAGRATFSSARPQPKVNRGQAFGRGRQ